MGQPTQPNPLPQQYITDEPGIGGRIKARPEDFLVDELPLYEPCGEGEHLYVRVQKTGMAHVQMMSILAKTFDVHRRQIGFAGMKDKVGVTQQTVSIHLPGGNGIVVPSFDTERLQILWAARHRNKIKRGHLAGNRFSIRIREVEPTSVVRAKAILHRLEETGVPDYFGRQRFGYRMNNHIIGAAIIQHDWDEALRELLGTTGSPFPDYQRERREMFDAGERDALARQWSPSERQELTISKALGRGWSAERSVRSVGRSSVDFWVNAFQSAVFNRVLDGRIAAGTLATLEPGDLAWKHDSRSVFAVTGELITQDTLPQRLQVMEISPSGPQWGRHMTRAGGEIDAAEVRALAAHGLTPEQLAAAPGLPEGARRPLRVPLGNAEIDAGADEHGPYIRLAFDLPRGAYATVALREIMKADD